VSADRPRRPVPRLALNQQEAAESLGMSVDSFESHVKPMIACVRIGVRKLYPVSEWQRWLDDEATLHGRRLSRAKRL